MISKSIKFILYSGGLFTGLMVYLITKKTPSFGYQSMIHLFCITRGYSNDWLSKIIGFIKKPYHFTDYTGILEDITLEHRAKVIADLNEQGYHVFAKKLPEELCDKLLAFATSHPSKIRPMSGQAKECARLTVYSRQQPEAVRYDFQTQDLLENEILQTLIADLSFTVIAQDYLGAKPTIDILTMWWHTAYSDQPDKDAAQFYHFDMDRPKWLKFFIYLTDVSADNGPHVFVKGSHKTNGIPEKMLSQGYTRLTDKEVVDHYGVDNIIEFVAPRGTIIAEDTRGLHKGKHVKQDDRLILQIEFTNTLFGAIYPKTKFPEITIKKIKALEKDYPKLYSAFK